MGIVVMYHHTRVFHHVGTQAIPILAVSAGKRQSVMLFEARLVEQIGRTTEVIKLRGGLVPSHVHGGGSMKTIRASLLREDLYHPIGRIRTIERGGRTTTHIFYMVDVLHGNIAQRARRRHLTHGHVANGVRLGAISFLGIIENGTGIEVVCANAVNVDNGSRI